VDAIGRSASDVLTESQLALAGRTLAQTRLSVAEIGESVGYLRYRAFKRQVGMTPGAMAYELKTQSY
jgi:AraC family transcriptional activator of mtrCDE